MVYKRHIIFAVSTCFLLSTTSLLPQASAEAAVFVEKVVALALQDDFGAVYDLLANNSPLKLIDQKFRNKEIKKKLKPYIKSYKIGYSVINGKNVLLPSSKKAYQDKLENEKLVERMRQRLERETPLAKYSRNDFIKLNQQRRRSSKGRSNYIILKELKANELKQKFISSTEIEFTGDHGVYFKIKKENFVWRLYQIEISETMK